MNKKWTGKRLLASFLALILALSTFCFDGLVVKADEPDPQDPGPQTETFEIYKDADCTTPYEGGECIYGGNTVYAKISTTQEGREVSILGYSFDNENFSWPDGGAPEGYFTESQNGFTYSYDGETQIASLTIPEDKYNDDVIFIGQVYDDAEHNWCIDIRRWVRESQKGLVYCDRYETDHFLTYRYDDKDGKNVSEYRRGVFSFTECTGGLIQFALSSNDEIEVDADGKDNLIVLTKDNTPKVESADDVSAFHLIWSDEFNGFSYYAEKSGTYSVHFEGIEGKVVFNVTGNKLLFKIFNDPECTIPFTRGATSFGNTLYLKTYSYDENIDYEILGYAPDTAPNYEWGEDYAIGYYTDSADGYTFSSSYDSTNRIGTASITFPDVVDEYGYNVNFVLRATYHENPDRYEYYGAYGATACFESSIGLVVCDYLKDGQFVRFGQNEYYSWSEYSKWHEMTEGESRPLSFAYCPTEDVFITNNGGQLSDNLTVLNITESDRSKFEIRREENGQFVSFYAVDYLRYDSNDKCFYFEPKNAGKYRIYYKDSNAIPTGNNYVTYDVRPQTKHYELYSDAQCKARLAQPCIGDTVYAKVWTDEGDDDELSIVGYGYNWYKNRTPDNWYETESKDGFVFSVDQSTGVAALTLPNPGFGYEVTFAVERIFNNREDSEVTEQLRFNADYSRGGLLLCDYGDPINGFNEFFDYGMGPYSNYYKNTSVGVYDRRTFLLANNPGYTGIGDDGTIKDRLISLGKDDANKLTVKILNEETGNYEDTDDILVDFGFVDSSDKEVAHFYFNAYRCGNYIICYENDDDNKYNFVNIRVEPHMLALYTDESHADDTFLSNPEIITSGKEEYYLYIDESDPSVKITDRFFGIIEQGKTPRYYSFATNDGKFYSQTIVNGVWKIDAKATDLKDYLTLESLGNGVYKVVFKAKEYQIQFAISGTREEPNGDSSYVGDERFYNIFVSNAGKLGVLDWLDGWENLGEEFDPEVLYRGGDEENYATFHTDTEYWLSSDYTYFVPGILKDEKGEDADLIPEDAEVKIYKFNKTWTDVTAKINPVYVGLPESEDLVTKGLWRIKNNDIGQYKMEVKMGDDVYSMEYRVVLPSVGLYSSATSYTASTLAQVEVFQENNAKTPKVYYLYGKDWGNNGLVGELAEVEIMWPDYTGKCPTRYTYEDGKFINEEGEDASDEVATIFKIEKTTTKGLYKLTPWPCDTEIRFNFAFGEDGYIAGNNYFFAQSQKGLVVNECVDTDNQAAPGVWTGSFYEGDEYNYNKSIGANVGDTRLFALAVNANDNYVSENNCALTRLSAMTDLVVKKVDADGNLVDVDESTVLKYENNSVFSFVSKTEGTYRIIYKNTSYVNVYVNAHNFGLYTLDAGATEYTFDDSNALLGDGIELTAEQAIDGKAEFYVVINGDNVDLDNTYYTLIEEYWSNEEDDTIWDYIIYSADSSKAKTGGHTTYEQVDLTGKKVTLYGKEIENAIVYKVTTTRNGNPGLAYRNFILAAADTSDATYKSAVESDVKNFFDGPLVDFVNFNYAPADISNAEVSVKNKEINIQSNGSFASVEIVDSDVTVTINGKEVTNKYLYSFKEDEKTLFKTQSIYPGTCKLQVNGVWDFNGFAEGEFEITKRAMSHIGINGNEFKFKFSAAEGRYVPTSMPYALSELEEGVDYEVVIEEYIENAYTATITALPESKYISGVAYINNSTKEDCGELETPEIGETITMPYDGNAKTVKLKVVCDGEVLKEGRDYKIVVAGEPVNVNEDGYEITIKGIGNYASCNSLTKTLKITPIDISKATVTGLPTKVNYNADIDLKNVTVTLNKAVLPASAWELSGYKKTKAGTQNIQIKGVGNYTGSISKTITVNPDTALTSKNFKIVQADETEDFTYPNAPTADDFKVQVKGSDGNYTDLDAAMYSITVSSTDKPGKVTVTATGKPETGYSGTITAMVTYKAETLTKEMLGDSLDGKTFMYVPGVGRQLDSCFDKNYVQGTDYTVKYANDTKVGDKATATVTGIGNYTGTFSYTYKITQLNFDDDIDVKVKNLKAPENKYYTEKEGENADVAAADFILVYVDDHENEFTVPTSDYTVTAQTKTYKSGSKTAPIEYTFTITGKTNCTGDLDYKIYVGSLEREDISTGYEIKVKGESAPLVKGKVAPFERTYTGTSVIAASDVTLWKKDGAQIDSANYKVTLANMTNAGKGSIIVTATGDDYTGVLTADVNILPYEVVDASDEYIGIRSTVEIFNIPLKGKVDYGNIEITYDGEAIDPSNYTFSYSVPKVANDEKASLTVKYKGNYKGTVVYTPETLSGMGMDTTLCGSPIYSWSEGSEFSITGTQTYEYTGNAIKPKFTVKAYGKKLTENKDYTLSYYCINDAEEVDNMQAVSDYYVYVHGCGMYSGDNGGGEDFVISVKGASIAKAGITLAKTKYSYGKDSFDNGTDAYGKITKVMLGKTELTEDEDYTVEFIGNKKPGTATVKITGIGNYSGTATKTFTIDGKIDINEVTVDYVEEFVAYNPKGAIPETILRYNGDELVYNQDYTVTASKNNKKLTPDGEYAYATIKGKGKYTGTLSIVYPYSIVPRLIDEEEEPMTYSNVKEMTGKNSELEDVTLYVGGTTYNGKGQNSFDPKPKVDGTVLKKGTDYDVYYIPWKDFENVTAATDMSRYATCKDAGSYCVLVVYKGNYDGVSYIAYRVAPLNISKVKANSFKIDYTGKDLLNERLIEASYGNDVLVQDKDFNVVYWSKMVSKADATDLICDIRYDCNDIKKILKLDITGTTSSGADIESSSVGSHVAYMIGRGNFCGVKEVKYEILGEDIKKLDIKAVDVRFNPNDETQETTIYGTYTDANGITRYYDSDNANKDGFILEYSSNTKVGTGKVKVSHKCFKGSKTISYKILPRTMDEEWPTAEETAVYDSKGAKPSIEVKFTDNYGREYVLVEGKDYTVSYKDNKACNDTKKAVATIKCKGNFEGTWTHNFNVEKASIKRMSIKATAGNTWKPTVKITSDSGAVLKEKTDYQIKYYYMNDTMVKCGKSYVKRSAEDEVNAKDTVVSGTKIKVQITACGNYGSSTSFKYTYAGKYTVYDFN